MIRAIFLAATYSAFVGWFCVPEMAAQAADPALPPPAENFQPPKGLFVYSVNRGRSTIGTQTINFQSDGEKLVVDINVKIGVKLLGLDIYGFNQDTEEVWHGNRMVAVRSMVDDDGDSRRVELAEKEGVLTGTYNGKVRTVPAGTFPNSLWHPDTIFQQQIVDTTRAKLRGTHVSGGNLETVHLPGGSVQARHYSMQGEFRREAWYDAQGVLIAAELIARDGSRVRQELIKRP